MGPTQSGGTCRSLSGDAPTPPRSKHVKRPAEIRPASLNHQVRASKPSSGAKPISVVQYCTVVWTNSSAWLEPIPSRFAFAEQGPKAGSGSRPRVVPCKTLGHSSHDLTDSVALGPLWCASCHRSYQCSQPSRFHSSILGTVRCPRLTTSGIVFWAGLLLLTCSS